MVQCCSILIQDIVMRHQSAHSKSTSNFVLRSKSASVTWTSGKASSKLAGDIRFYYEFNHSSFEVVEGHSSYLLQRGHLLVSVVNGLSRGYIAVC